MMKAIAYGALGALALDLLRDPGAKVRIPVVGPLPTISMLQGPQNGMLSSVFGK